MWQCLIAVGFLSAAALAQTAQVEGDTMAVIAKTTGAKPQDIIHANKLADPSRITTGQTLFIPGGK